MEDSEVEPMGFWKRREPADYVTPWNEVIAEKHYAETERMLLGMAGKARVVGNRIVDERERQVEMRRKVDELGAKLNEQFQRMLAEHEG